MKRKMSYRWHLRQLMAAKGMFATSELGPLLAERGIELSREQTYRLVVGTPERLNLHVLAALCDILECTPAELIEPVVETRQSRKTATGGTGAEASTPVRELRPTRARLAPTPGKVTRPITAGRCPSGLHRRAPSTKGPCGACKREDAIAHAVGVLSGLLSGVDEEVIAATVSAVAPTSDRADAVADHFSGEPDAVTSGASSGPLVALRVLNGLIATGVTGVHPPTCVTCRRPQRHFVIIVDDGRQCCDCRQAVLREPCAGCGRVTKVAARPEGGPMCQRCWAHDPASWRPCGLCATVGRKAGTMAGIHVGACCYVPPGVRCTVCGLAKGVHPYKTRRPVCTRCQGQPQVACSICERPAAPSTDGTDPLCALCARHPAQRCVGCGAWTSTRDRSGRPRCLDCYTRTARPCGRCGKVRAIVRRARGDDPELCGLCWRGPIAVCEHCGKTRPCRGEQRAEMLCAACAPRSREPCIRCQRTRTVAARLPTGSICAACYQTFLRTRTVCPGCGDLRRLLDHPDHPMPVCSDCCDDRDRQICEQCNTEDALPRGGRCTRCALIDVLDDLLGDEHQRAVNGMEPVYDTLTSLTRYRSVYDLLTRPPATAADLLHRVAIGEIARTHEAFAQLPQQRTTIAVEALLTVAGVLPPCDIELLRLERWIDRYLAGIDHVDHQRVLRRYATWHVLARARQHPPLSDIGRHSRIRRLRVAHRFLDWLAARNVTLADCRQVDLDEWTLIGPATWNDARTFITWAQRQRLLPARLELPARTANTASPVSGDDDERWQIARALLHDDGYPLDVRVAGLLACLYAQPLTRVVTLNADDIIATADGVTIRLGTTPIDVPEPFAAHLVALRDRHHHTSLVKATGTTHWLFPGHNPGQPRTVTPLAKKLRAHGIRVSNQRTAALAHLAISMPAVVVADLLGVAINTATRWAEHTRRDWTDYLAHRSAVVSPNGQRNTLDRTDPS